MKFLIFGYWTLCFLLPLAAQSQPNDQGIGTWQFVAKGSRYESGPAPQASIRRWVEMPVGKVRFEHDGTGADGKKFHTEFLAAYDGRPVPFIGGTLYDSVALLLRDRRTVKQSFYLNGKLTVKAVRKISRNGRTMTIDSRGVKPDGSKFRNWLVYSRIDLVASPPNVHLSVVAEGN